VLLRLIQQAGAEVRVVLTPGATRFVQPLTFTTLAQHPAFHDLWTEQARWSEHVHLGRWADAFVIAPCTVNTLAHLAQGLCENALDAVYLSCTAPVLLAPAADHEMITHPAVQANLQVLLARPRHHLAAPGEGYLASGLSGAGRMAEPETIVQQLITLLAPQPQPLAGKRVLITAGPTREPIDPVRFLSNHSTGKMGYALAQEARQLGAQVTLLSGPVQLPPPIGVELVAVETAAELFTALRQHAPAADVCILSAAVADYRPAIVADQKIKKSADTATLELTKTEDGLAWLGANTRPGQTVIGFALETRDAEAYGQDKLIRKNADLIVVNTLADPGAGFGHDTNQVTVLGRAGKLAQLPLASKTEIARQLWPLFLNHLSEAR
jgi:phosphopantothenoylcysteine decarboxylase/phosphopantothenate--cysteine ligase